MTIIFGQPLLLEKKAVMGEMDSLQGNKIWTHPLIITLGMLCTSDTHTYYCTSTHGSAWFSSFRPERNFGRSLGSCGSIATLKIGVAFSVSSVKAGMARVEERVALLMMKSSRPVMPTTVPAPALPRHSSSRPSNRKISETCQVQCSYYYEIKISDTHALPSDCMATSGAYFVKH